MTQAVLDRGLGWKTACLVLLVATWSGQAGHGQSNDAETSPVRIAPVRLPAEEHGIGQEANDAAFSDLAGKRYSLRDYFAQSDWTVVAVTSTSCPLSNKYLPTLRRLAEQYAGEGVQFLLVNATEADDVGRMREIQKDFGSHALYAFDPDALLVSALRATTTTDSLILDREGKLRFHGALDDQYGLGYALERPRQQYLEPALTSLLAGKTPLITATTAPGCELVLSDSQTSETATTYYADIASIVNKRCLHCHRQGGVAPFDLESYDALAAHAPMIRDVVERGVMPPWFAAPQPGETTSVWANDPSLTDEEKRQLFSWIDGRMPAGDPELAPEPVEFPEGWMIGQPDAIYKFDQPVMVKATGTMPYQNIQVSTDQMEDRWVEAIEIQPGDRSVVHHVIVSVLRPGASLREAASEAGGYWGAYVPGTSVLTYPEGLAKRLPRGAVLNFQMHYTPNGRATEDSTRIGLKFASQPPEHEVLVHGLAGRGWTIQPGDPRCRLEKERKIDFEAKIISFLPHAHLRGVACRYELDSVDGTTRVLLDVPHYDFNWQLRYVPKEPITIRKGDTLRYIAWYDNSADNPANPDPTAAVEWGPQTTDEMLLGYVEYYVPGAELGLGEGRIRRGGALADRVREAIEQRVAGSGAFDRIDSDGDGRLSWEEVQSKLPGGNRLEALFKELDSDSDGYLSKVEAAQLRRGSTSR